MKVSTTAVRYLLTAIAAVVPSLVSAPGAAESGYQQAHVHGVAELTLALEGPDLELVLTSPAISVVGFEHRASSPGQVEAVAEAKARLRDGTKLFTFTGTECALENVEVDVSAVLESDSEENAVHDEHDKHEPEKHHHEGNESHSDFSAHYEYSCTDTSDLEALLVGAGELPFGLETINVMWVSDRGQGATVLNADNRRIEFN